MYCQGKGIRARYDSCPNCGKARGIETIFYLPDNLNEATLTQEEKEKTTNEPDWLCEYCGAYNRSDCSTCPKCGASRSESKKHYGTIHKLTGGFFGRKK